MREVCGRPRLVGVEKSERFRIAADIPRHERVSIYRQWMVGMGTVRALARRNGVEEADIEECLQHEVAHEIEAARVDGYQAGKRSAWNLPPMTTAGLRRAA